MKNEEFKIILKEWNDFLKEEKEKFDHNLKYDGKKIETLGDLKNLLKNISNEEKIEKGNDLVKKLSSVGINLLDLDPSISAGKALVGLVYSLSKLKDSDSEKLGNLKGFDYSERLQSVVKEKVLVDLLKTFAENLAGKYTDETRLEEIDINYYVANRVFKKIKQDLRKKYNINKK